MQLLNNIFIFCLAEDYFSQSQITLLCLTWDTLYCKIRKKREKLYFVRNAVVFILYCVEQHLHFLSSRRLLWWCFRREGERKKLSHFPRLPCVLLLNMAVSPILVPNNNNNPISWDSIVTSRESTPALP